MPNIHVVEEGVGVGVIITPHSPHHIMLGVGEILSSGGESFYVHGTAACHM